MFPAPVICSPEPHTQTLDSESSQGLLRARSSGPRLTGRPVWHCRGDSASSRNQASERSEWSRRLGPLQGPKNPPLSQSAHIRVSHQEKPKPQPNLLFTVSHQTNSNNNNKPILPPHTHIHTHSHLNHRGVPCPQESPWDSPGRALSLLSSQPRCFQGHRGVLLAGLVAFRPRVLINPVPTQTGDHEGVR